MLATCIVEKFTYWCIQFCPELFVVLHKFKQIKCFPYALENCLTLIAGDNVLNMFCFEGCFGPGETG